MSPTSPTNPVLVNLPYVIGGKGMEAFGNRVVDRIDKLTSWRYSDFCDIQLEGEASAGQTGQSIAIETCISGDRRTTEQR